MTDDENRQAFGIVVHSGAVFITLFVIPLSLLTSYLGVFHTGMWQRSERARRRSDEVSFPLSRAK